MKIISYLTYNYSSGNCPKLIESFQEHIGYFLILDGTTNSELNIG